MLLIMNYLSVSDEELIDLAQKNDILAEEEIVLRYGRLVRSCSRPFFLVGGESEDLIQEGMMGLISAIRSFDRNAEAKFKTYAERCIRNRLISAVKSASSLKHIPLNNGVSLDIVLSDDAQTGMSGLELFRRVPEEQVLERESKSGIVSAFSQCLSKFELEILDLYLEGLSYREMAEHTGKTEKSIDNAVQRIRKKLARQPN